MQIISNTNTNTANNTLNITVNEGDTIYDILMADAVMDFFDNEYDSEQIKNSILTINGAEAEAILANIDSINAEEDMVLTIDLYGEVTEEERAAHTAGKAFITCGGGISKEVAIIDGVTTVNDMITPSVAAFCATSVDQLRNRKVYINDSEATTSSVVHNGDTVVLEARKAGDKGCDFSYTVIDADGSRRQVSYNVDEVYSYQDLLDMLREDEIIEEDSAIVKINDVEIPDVLYNAVVTGNAEEDAVVEIDTVFLVPEEEDNDVDEDDGANAPARGTLGQVKVFIQGSCQHKDMNIVSGVTLLSDVVFSDKILNMGAMTRTQAESLIYSINGVQSSVNSVLNAGDEISMEARKAGQKGL